uniref:PorP/SprF family type IX secretion system membrane protein n=1 Tax=Pseudopedobacter sp. TaxID=1936787 RepID=UPI003341B278
MRLFAFTLILILSVVCKAQQKPQYTQYMQNMQVINPALSGIYHGIYVKAATRNQWSGLESAPKTNYITVSAPLNIDKDMLTAGSADFGIEDVGTREERDAYYSSENHHGIGLMVLDDRTGSLSRASANLTYAYHIALGDLANLSVGVGAGMGRISLNTHELRFENELEPLVMQGNATRWSPDVNAGIYLYGASFFAGASVQQVLKQPVSFAQDYQSDEVPHYFFTAGYRFWAGQDFSFMPSVMLKRIKPLPSSIDLNLKIAFRNNVWLGGSYRKNDSFSAIFGFTVSKIFDVGYAYDFTQSEL